MPFETVWDNGFRQITTSTKPIQTPEDLKNFKIRVPVVPLWVAMFKSLGAAPVSLPLSEAYLALQTKVADGQENPLPLIDSAKFYEVQKYCSLTNHAWDGFWFVASGRIWKGVPAEVQTGHRQAHQRGRPAKQREDIAKASVELQKTLEGKRPDLQQGRYRGIPQYLARRRVLHGGAEALRQGCLGAVDPIRRRHRLRKP